MKKREYNRRATWKKNNAGGRPIQSVDELMANQPEWVYNRRFASKKKEPKRMLANANQEQAARKVENKKPRTVDYPRKTRLAPDIVALTPAEVREFWRQTVSAERSLWRVTSRFRAERASDQSTSRLI